MVVLLILAIALVSALSSHSVYGPGGESYALTPVPGRSQEVDAPGVALVLSVTNAAIGSIYRFTWSVTDPSGGAGKNATNSTTTTQSSFSLSVVYPRDFPPGTSLGLVGNYTVNIQQTSPMANPSVATGQFQVGLTDGKSYQRTFQVSIKAENYRPGESVTINISHGGTSTPGYPTTLTAGAGIGAVSTTWQILPSVPVGQWMVSLSGTITTKAVPDSQTFTVYPTNVTIPQLAISASSIQRTQTAIFDLSPSYLSGLPVQTGQATVRVLESDSVTSHNLAATYNLTISLFQAIYKIPLNAQTGIWVATVNIDDFNDGYGNGGPQTGLARGFSVQPAALTVSFSSSNQTYAAGSILPIYATIIAPDGTVVNSGTVTATLSHAGTKIKSPIPLSFVQGQGKWVSSYQVDPSDPSGIWQINVTASDSYGNSGSTSYSVVVNSSSSQSSILNTFEFILVVSILAVAAGAVLFYLLLRFRRNVDKREVKIDLKMVDDQVGRIEEKEFFQNVKKQIEEKRVTDQKGTGPEPSE